MDINQQLNEIVKNIVAEVNTNLQSLIEKSVRAQITEIVKQVPFQIMFNTALKQGIADETFNFPESSIPTSALQTDDLILSGNQIEGGIIKKFGSTGIDDQSTACQLTIMDDITVVENNLLTKDLTVKGTTTIEGDLNVTGTMPETSPLFISVVNAATNNVRTSLDQTMFKNYASIVTKSIKDDGLDLNKITVNGQEIIDGHNLGNFITSSNLQKVGVLQELQVSGESFLGQTLYTSTQRVGINTIEPTQALSVWDQEIEIGFGKKTSETAVIETPRNHTLVLSTNKKNNITLTPDGAITVNKINIGTMSFSVGDRPPSDNQSKGSVVFNSNPNLGGPLGWVSLGDARWANFGIID